MTNPQKQTKPIEKKPELTTTTDEQNAQKLQGLLQAVLQEARDLKTRKKSHASDLFIAVEAHDAFLDQVKPSEPLSESKAS